MPGFGATSSWLQWLCFLFRDVCRRHGIWAGVLGEPCSNPSQPYERIQRTLTQSIVWGVRPADTQPRSARQT